MLLDPRSVEHAPQSPLVAGRSATAGGVTRARSQPTTTVDSASASTRTSSRQTVLATGIRPVNLSLAQRPSRRPGRPARRDRPHQPAAARPAAGRRQEQRTHRLPTTVDGAGPGRHGDQRIRRAAYPPRARALAGRRPACGVHLCRQTQPAHLSRSTATNRSRRYSPVRDWLEGGPVLRFVWVAPQRLRGRLLSTARRGWSR
jgi:hypothetical protein